MAFVALLDANVLHPAYLRDALLRLAEAEVYQVRWIRQILGEMCRNVLKNNTDLPEESVGRLVRNMEREVDAPTPDEFLRHQREIGDPDFLLGVFEDWASHLKSPPLNLEELLARLARVVPNFGEMALGTARERAHGR